MTSTAHILPFTHTDRCEALAIGANVLNLIAAGETILNLDELAAIVDSNPRPRCTCGKDELTRVENQLRLARKAQRALNADANLYSADHLARRTADLADYVTALIAQRDAIRKALA